ncbi:MAG: SAM-dependent methyltransferase [Elusimicrobia bacterium GWC2_65_9]|nr:MAG: SAM-dependent methyltransferase [Elusimicrobia bacterium GWC2_65_9]
MAYVDFVMKLHKKTSRDYVRRVIEHDKAESAEIAIQYGKDYWDGERRYGYGGYKYDGRWRAVAEDMARHYGLKPGASILDVGCGKGFLLHEFTQVLQDAKVAGVDISRYALDNAKPEVKPFLREASAVKLPFPDKSFDFVVSITTLHNLYNYELHEALQEVERVARGPKHVIVETYRNEREKVNLLYWQLTCRSFHTPREWEWVFEQAGYTGDYSYIVFE